MRRRQHIVNQSYNVGAEVSSKSCFRGSRGGKLRRSHRTVQLTVTRQEEWPGNTAMYWAGFDGIVLAQKNTQHIISWMT